MLALTVSNNRCPICKYHGIFWDKSGRARVVCPQCRSLERHRAVWLSMKRSHIMDLEDLRVLHVAPETCLASRIRHRPTVILFQPLDKIRTGPGKGNVTDLSRFDDGSFDLIICNHVIEHVRNDIQALGELCRVLSRRGAAYITVPVTSSHTELVNNPRKGGHVWRYGEDFESRMQLSGFNTIILRGFKKKYRAAEIVFVGSKRR